MLAGLVLPHQLQDHDVSGQACSESAGRRRDALRFKRFRASTPRRPTYISAWFAQAAVAALPNTGRHPAGLPNVTFGRESLDI